MRGPYGHLLAMALVLAGLFAAPAQAQDYPNRPVHILVGFGPGSVADLSARVLANRLGQVLGQQFIVENKTGAGSAVAAEAGARAPKDGYTLFLGSSATLTNQAISPNPNFDMAKDFVPIALVTEVKVMLVVHPSTGVKSVKELIALAKAKDGGLLYASVGPGSAPHLAAELFDARAGVKMIHVPYQGSPQALTDLIAGRTAVMFCPAPTAVPQVEAGKIVALATAAATRAINAPDVPTMAEAGMADFETGIWFGLMAPVGNAARHHREARQGGAGSDGCERGDDRAAHPGPRAPRRRPRRVRALHRDRDREVERSGAGRGVEEVAALPSPSLPGPPQAEPGIRTLAQKTGFRVRADARPGMTAVGAARSANRSVLPRHLVEPAPHLAARAQPHPARIAQFRVALPSLVKGAPRPADRMVAVDERAPALAVAVPQLRPHRRAAHRTPDHLGHDLPARQVEPDDGGRAVPDEVAHHVIVAVDHPALAVDQRRDPRAKLGIGKRDPVRLVNDRVRARRTEWRAARRARARASSCRSPTCR